MLKNIPLTPHSWNSTRANLAWAILLQAIEKGTGYIVLAVLTRALVKEELGGMFFALSIAALTAVALTFGTDTYLVRTVANDPQNSLLHLSRTLSIRAPIILAGYASLNILVRLVQPGFSPIMLLVSGSVFLDEVYYSFSAFYSGRKQIVYRLAILGGFKILSLFVVSYVAFTSRALIPVLWTNLFFSAALVIAIFAVTQRNVGKLRLRWEGRAGVEILKRSFPFFLLNGLTLAHMRFDSVMVGAMLGLQQVANYELGIKLVEATRFIVRPLNSVFLPVFSEYAHAGNWKKFRRRFVQLNVAACSIGILFMLLIQVFGFPIIEWLFGVNYRESVSPSQILFISVPFLFVSFIAGVAANALHLERTSVVLLLAAVIVNIGSNYFVLPVYGIVGAAWVTVITQAILTGGMLILVLPNLFRPPPFPAQPTPATEPLTLPPEDDV